MKQICWKNSAFRNSLGNSFQKIRRKCGSLALCLRGSLAETLPEADRKASFIEQQCLPALDRMCMEDRQEHIMPLQVIKRMENLNLSEDDLLRPQECEEEICSLFLEHGSPDYKKQAVFTGNTAKELNAFLLGHAGMDVLVKGREVFIDETILVPDNTFLKGEDTILTGGVIRT